MRTVSRQQRTAVFRRSAPERCARLARKLACEAAHTFSRKNFQLPDTYYFEGEELNLEQGLLHFKTDGLIVLHKGDLLYENYWNGNRPDSQHIAFSVTKSFVSALVGIAHNEGLIDSIEDPITKYLPDFNGTGYEGVRIKDILQM